MDLEYLNSVLDEELDEGIRDIFDNVKRAMRRIGQARLKKVAKSFFDKHPGLLQQVRQILLGQRNESQLSEGFSKTLVSIGIFLALSAGLVPMQAAASTPINVRTGESGMVMQQEYNASMPEAFSRAIINQVEKQGKQVNAENLWDATQSMFRNLQFVSDTGEVIEVNSPQQMKSAVSAAGGIFLHDNPVPETGAMTSPQAQQSAKLVTNAFME